MIKTNDLQNNFQNGNATCFKWILQNTTKLIIFQRRNRWVVLRFFTYKEMLMVAVFIMPLEVADPSDLHTILFRCVGLSSHPVREGKRVMGSNPIETSLLFDIIPSSPVVCSWFVRICYHSLISPIWINRMT